MPKTPTLCRIGMGFVRQDLINKHRGKVRVDDISAVHRLLQGLLRLENPAKKRQIIESYPIARIENTE